MKYIQNEDKNNTAGTVTQTHGAKIIKGAVAHIVHVNHLETKQSITEP
jgi:hypothetical protein